ncbi:MAG: DNA-binding protein [Thermoproteota archaeon]|nr:MAG: DNA-binding protein [Candidatus Korarchaeota archaeon]
MIIDTPIAIQRVANGETIDESITSVTLIEFPPIKDYEKFDGKIYFMGEEEQLTAVLLQIKLRKIGSPMSIGDLLIAATCINKNETLLTKDKDFMIIKEVEPTLKVVIED